MRKKILVVDDDAELRLALGILLEDRGYDVIFAENGLDSIFKARMHMPSVILLDLSLPGPDGFSVLDELRTKSNLWLIPVIVISGHDRMVMRERALQSGAKAFLQKPVDNKLLFSVIQQVLEQQDRTARLVCEMGLSEAGGETSQT
jgi:twitching motility two-component system response regulator PilH